MVANVKSLYFVIKSIVLRRSRRRSRPSFVRSLLSENDDVSTTPPPGCRHSTVSIQDSGQTLSGGFLVDRCNF